MFEISVKSDFSAAHHLAGYPGSCAAMHGHNWEVEVFLRGERTDEIGMVADFRHVKRLLRETLAALDHRDLGSVPPFDRQNPTSEHLARYLYEALSRGWSVPGCRVHRVRVRETPTTSATYWPGDDRP